jgi:hypothetical protein
MTNPTYNANTEPLFYANYILPFDKLILQSKLILYILLNITMPLLLFLVSLIKTTPGKLIIILEMLTVTLVLILELNRSEKILLYPYPQPGMSLLKKYVYSRIEQL